MARLLQEKLITFKKELLEQHLAHVQSLAGRAEQVLNLAQSWLENDSAVNFLDLSKEMEATLMILATAAPQDRDCLEAAARSGGTGDLGLTEHSESNDCNLKKLSNETPIDEESQNHSSHQRHGSSQNDRDFQSDVRSQQEQRINKYNSPSTKILKHGDQNVTLVQGESPPTDDSEKGSLLIEDMLAEVKEQVCQLKSKMKKQNKQQERLEEQMHAFEEDAENIKENIDELSTQLKSSQGEESMQLRDLDTRLEYLETDVGILRQRIEETAAKLREFVDNSKTFSQNVLDNCKKLYNLEDKFADESSKWRETSQKFESLYGDVLSQYELVCTVLASRLAPLEKLKEMFNHKLDDRQTNLNKLTEVCSQMADLLPRISQLERTLRLPVKMSWNPATWKWQLSQDLVLPSSSEPCRFRVPLSSKQQVEDHVDSKVSSSHFSQSETSQVPGLSPSTIIYPCLGSSKFSVEQPTSIHAYQRPKSRLRRPSGRSKSMNQ